MVTEMLKWIVKERSVYNVDTGKNETLRFDHWLRSRKWWWSILFWAIGVMLTNAYVMYVTVCDEYDIPKRDRKTHMEFRKDIALAWINPKEYNAELRQAASMKTPTRRRRRRDEDESGVSGTTLDSALQSTVTTSTSRPAKQLKRTRMSDDALDPVAGKLSCRLDPTLDHIPIRPPNGKVRCSIHRWVEVETQKDFMLCPSCDVNLCLDCYITYSIVFRT